jgi:hypothetical protein
VSGLLRYADLKQSFSLPPLQRLEFTGLVIAVGAAGF